MSARPGLMAILSLALGLMAACRTPNQNEAPAEKEGGAKIVAMPAPPPQPRLALTPLPPPAPPPRPECPPGDVACALHYDPVVCSASGYDGRPVATAERLMAWGTNACVGKLKLAKEACNRGLLPSKLGHVQCVPDASAGGCPPPPVPCSASGKPMVCAASQYGEQKLSPDTTLSAAGRTECAARDAVLVAACRQNLNPTLVKGVTCVADPTEGECPPKPQPCHDPAVAATCTAKRLGGKILGQPLTAKGATACVAKAELARQACGLGGRPSTLDDLVCTFGN